LQTSTGYEARLSQAFIDMANGIVTSDEHVDVKLTNGTITSDRIKITGNGEVITFEGNVVMHLDHFDAGGTPAEPAAAPAAPEPAPRPGKTRSSSSKTANTK
jgi:lipopolysaccharide export system protein LptC